MIEKIVLALAIQMLVVIAFRIVVMPFVLGHLDLFVEKMRNQVSR